MNRFCSQCGGEIFGGARFCRACGTPVAAGADDPEATLAAEGGPLDGDRTPSAASPDSAPLAAAPLPSAAPRWDGPTVPAGGDPEPVARASGGNGPFLAVVAIVAVVMLAGGGISAYLLLGGDDPPSDADWAQAWSEAGGDYGSADYGGADDNGYDASADEPASAEPPADGGATGDASGGDSASAVAAAAATGGEPLTPTFDGGLYVQLGSFLSDSADREAERLRGRGIDAFVLDSDDAAELLPGFRVVVAGPLAGASEQRRVLRAGRKADVAGIAKTLTPVAESTGPSAVGGAAFAGALRGPDAEVDVELSFDGDGRSGRIDYAGRRCDAELELIGAAGAVLTYDHRVTRGGCRRTGTLAVKPVGGEARVTWRHATSYDFLGATLPAAG